MKNVNSDIAYDYIRKSILNGTFRPGQALLTNDLSGEIGVSRTPVRDALRQLEADGLVTIRAHRGASVKSMEFKEYREMCGLRLALETHAASEAAENRTGDELREMKQALEAMRTLTGRLAAPVDDDKSMIEQLRREDVRFHIAIITAGKNELLKKEVLRLHIISRVVAGLTPGAGSTAAEKPAKDLHRKEVQASHDEIFQAIERGDALAAGAAMRRHIEDIIECSMRHMTGSRVAATSRELSEEELSYTT
jgi:DNA-binding GntR family transcriptional regulator